MIPLKHIGVRMIQKSIQSGDYLAVWKGTYSNPELNLKEIEIRIEVPFTAIYAHWRKFKFGIRFYDRYETTTRIKLQNLDDSKIGSFRLKSKQRFYNYGSSLDYFLESSK